MMWGRKKKQWELTKAFEEKYNKWLESTTPDIFAVTVVDNLEVNESIKEQWFLALKDISKDWFTAKLNLSSYKKEDILKEDRIPMDHINSCRWLYHHYSDLVDAFTAYLQAIVDTKPEVFVSDRTSVISYTLLYRDILRKTDYITLVWGLSEPLLKLYDIPISQPYSLVKSRLDQQIPNFSTWSSPPRGVEKDTEAYKRGQIQSALENIQSTRPNIPDLMVEYFCDSPSFAKFFRFDVSVPVPEHTRFSHQLIVGGTGHGKTSLIENMLTKEQNGFCVIEPTGELARRVAERFDCLIIDPSEMDLALNMFDVDTGNEEIYNATVSLYEYIFGGLLGAELTQRQGTVFSYLIKLLFTIPNANIHTLVDLLENGKKYTEYMGRLEGTTKQFFEGQFFDKSFNPTKQQILTRLYGLLSNSTFERAFSSPVNELDFYSTMEEGKVIVINTAQDYFQRERSSIFGRYFIGLLMQATIRRRGGSPYFIYIDEAHQYFDDSIDDMLNQARKYNVGVVLATQNLSQAPDTLRASLMSSTAIKVAGGVNAQDANIIASNTNVDRERLNVGVLNWYVHVRGIGSGYHFCPPGALDKLPVIQDYKKTVSERSHKIVHEIEKPKEVPKEVEEVKTEPKRIKQEEPEEDDGWG